MSEEGNGHRIIMGPRGMRRNISREEAAEYIASASLKVGAKIYDEITKENERLFAMMKAEIDALKAEVEALKAEVAPVVPTAGDGRHEDDPSSHLQD